MKNDFRLFVKVFSMTFISIIIIILITYLIYRNIGMINQVILYLSPTITESQEVFSPTSVSSKIDLYTPNPNFNYQSVPTAIQYNIVPTPTQYIERGWSQKNLATNGFLIELPDNWNIEEYVFSANDICNNIKNLANYRLIDFGDYHEIYIHSYCGLVWDGETSICPPETQILDEGRGIARLKLKPNEFEYLHFTSDGNNFSCMGGWQITDQVNITADYKSRGEVDLATADDIVLSVHDK